MNVEPITPVDLRERVAAAPELRATHLWLFDGDFDLDVVATAVDAGPVTTGARTPAEPSFG
jgi:hypothetical protein